MYSHQGHTLTISLTLGASSQTLEEKTGMERKRDKQINIRLTESEYLNVYGKVEKSGLGISQYIRKCILGKEIKVISGLRKLNWELNRIGNNLNQLTRKVNEGKVVQLGDDISQINNNLNAVFKKISQIL